MEINIDIKNRNKSMADVQPLLQEEMSNEILDRKKSYAADGYNINLSMFD